jgi:hypothetical protein
MMRTAFCIQIIVLAFVSALCGSEINAVLATVNDQPVFLGDVLPLTRTAEYQAHAALKGVELENRIKELRRLAVQDIIDRRLLLAAYAEKPFKLPDGMVEQRLDDHAARLGCNSRQAFAALLRKENTSVEELRKYITEQLTAELTLYREVQPQIHVSPQEVFEYYQKNQKSYSAAETFELAMILLDKELSENDMKHIGEDILKNPADFSSSAKKYSKGPNAANGGDLGKIERSLLRKEFADALKKPEVGKIYGPLATTDGTVFLKLYGYQQESKTPFREVAPEIKKMLEKQKREAVIQKYLKKLRSDAVIRTFF